MTNRPIGVIGLGEMGRVIAARILSLGQPVVGHDSSPTAEDFDSPLFTRAGRPADVAVACDVVLVIVHTDAEVRDVVVGQGGILDSACKGTTVVVHSTVDPATCTALADRLKAHGLVVVDAGMSRGRGSMRDGVLTLFAGGTADAIESARWAFDLYSNNVVHAGPVGAGMALKLGNNLLLHANRLAMLEVAHLCESGGVAREALLSGVRSSTGSSWVLEHWGEADERALSDGLGTTPFVQRTSRELALALGFADRLGLHLPAATSTGRHLPAVLAEGLVSQLAASHEERNQVIKEYRANGGRLGGRREGWELLLLTTVGVRTGLHRTTPLGYLRDGQGLLVFASNGGSSRSPDWYQNLVAKPQVTVELGDRTFKAVAEELEGEEREQAFARQVALKPEFAQYQRDTSRLIPVIRLTEDAR
ncbi:nitroreductase family deazaflavin-dependent oxidoreductase [Kitasatospora acidiphila]|uniref:Nitroreductase family deazaflavin-dependent oxidoreductase n=1 Tax=Kitasatospora acidiphila TaxID=2567942 RepID=A0A540VYX0_9ACTN|nr:nitroreductase/quinone reductase family protein [Kitasatospora acidiphila]TQF01966.1 nitroreductase family deazaflavin-dependent oxidoreductase [Kitasatospora acidiphila]